MINLLLIAVIGLAIFVIWRAKSRKKSHLMEDEDWYLRMVLCKEDGVSQAMFWLSMMFLGVALLSFNRNLGSLLSWQTILFLTLIVGLIISYYFKVVMTLIFSLLGVMIWWSAQAAEWIQSSNIKGSAILAGVIFIALILYILGHLHEKEIKFKRFAMVYLILSLIPVIAALFFFSTKFGLEMLEGITQGAVFWGSWQITLLLILFIFLLIGTMIYALSEKLISGYETLAIFLIMILFAVIALLPPQAGLFENGVFSSAGIFWTIVFNLILFFTLVGVILLGYLRKEEWAINLGAFFLFLLIFIKYFDWFFTFLDKSIFFISAGILLFIVGWLMEKGRRYMLAEIEE